MLTARIGGRHRSGNYDVGLDAEADFVVAGRQYDHTHLGTSAETGC